MSATNLCPDELALEAYVDGECGAERAEIAAHLARCAACRARVAELEDLNALIRRAEIGIAAPPTLAARLQSGPARPVRRGLTRRGVIFGASAAAASIAGLALYTGFGRGEAAPLRPALFGDFETLLAAGSPLDYVASDPADLGGWLQQRVAFEMPGLGGFSGPQLAGAGLRGGRLCWLIGRRFAAVHFAGAGSSLCLYICRADGVRITAETALPTHEATAAIVTEGGISGAFWRHGDTANTLVGDLAPSDLAALAHRVRTNQSEREQAT